MYSKPKIAIIGLKGLPAFGGAAAVGENIIEQLKDKYDFTVYSISSHTYRKTGEFQGYKQIIFKKIPFKKLNILYYYSISAFHVLFLGDYQLVHLHHRDAVFILPFLRLRFKTIVTSHGMVLTEKWKKFDFIFKIFDWLFFRCSNIFTTVSMKDLRIVQSITKRPVFFIPNGCAFSDMSEKNHSSDIVFAAGRIVPSKGCHTFLMAAKELGLKNKIKIIGDLNQMSQYKDKLLNLAEGLNVEFFGVIKEKDKLFYHIRNACLFIFPSTIESMSMMLLEACSLNTPIICSDIPENRAVFNDHEVLFFRAGDSHDLCEKISWALENTKVMNTLAVSAIQKLKSDHDWRIIANKYAQLYEMLLK